MREEMKKYYVTNECAVDPSTEVCLESINLDQGASSRPDYDVYLMAAREYGEVDSIIFYVATNGDPIYLGTMLDSGPSAGDFVHMNEEIAWTDEDGSIMVWHSALDNFGFEGDEESEAQEFLKEKLESKPVSPVSVEVALERIEWLESDIQKHKESANKSILKLLVQFSSANQAYISAKQGIEDALNILKGESPRKVEKAIRYLNTTMEEITRAMASPPVNLIGAFDKENGIMEAKGASRDEIMAALALRDDCSEDDFNFYPITESA